MTNAAFQASQSLGTLLGIETPPQKGYVEKGRWGASSSVYACGNNLHVCFDSTKKTAGADFMQVAATFLQYGQIRPWFITQSVSPTDGVSRTSLVTFTPDLLKDMLKRKVEYKKDINALRFGYIGPTNGGRNGIAPLRTEDGRMIERVNRWQKTNESELLRAYEIGANYEGVKIVVHRKNGLRTIGVRDLDNEHIIFFEQMNYQL